MIGSRGPGRIRPRRRPDAVSPWPFVGMGTLAVCFVLYAASAAFAPWPAVAALMLVWVGWLVLAARWWTPHPTRLPWVGAAAVAAWFVLIALGARFLGWSA